MKWLCDMIALEETGVSVGEGGMMGRQQRGREVARQWWLCGGGDRTWLVCACVPVTGKRESPQGAFGGAIDKDSLGKFLSLVFRHSPVIQPCQGCHETKKKEKKKEEVNK